MYFNLLCFLFLSNHFQFATSQISAAELAQINQNKKIKISESNDENDIAEIANSTYGEDQTKLHTAIFKNYKKQVIPVFNQSLDALDVEIHVYINHISVNQKEQTMVFHGQLFATWMDSLAVWDPSNYNNIRVTYVRLWDIWTPSFKVANSATGVNQYFEFSKRGHATLVHKTTNMTKVEIYPTFSIKVSCFFDFSDYPFDTTTCPLRVYVPENFARIRLKNYYGLDSSVILGWGKKGANKTVISDWVFKGVNNNISYFINGEYVSQIPRDMSISWSIYNCYVTIKRYSGYFYITSLIPFIGCWLIAISTFFFQDRRQSAGIMIANLFIQSIYLHDMVKDAPSSTLNPPKIIVAMTVLLFCSAYNLFVNLVIGGDFSKIKEFKDSKEGSESKPFIINPQQYYLDYTIQNVIDFVKDRTTKETIVAKVTSLEQGMPDFNELIIETTDEEHSTDIKSIKSASTESLKLTITTRSIRFSNIKIRYVNAFIYVLVFMFSLLYVLF
uniref:Neur_chan_LBD domain-containing protein n=1 Tax=Rhabditophanes sp. KR3021 TaxID=114890 RepID=A0AC35U0X5_9BILA